MARSKSEHYSILKIKKRSGKLRTVHNPDGVLRILQFKILTEILNKIDVPDYIYAFEQGRSIPDMAKMHVKKNLVISLDIKDFFNSIVQDQVESLFRAMEISSTPARILSELCTYKFFVPVGALTSPKIGNLFVASTFGPEVKAYCEAKGLALSIYADDITMSTEEVFPSLEVQSAFVKDVIDTVSQMVNKSGLRINRKKTKLMKPFMRQWVCGTVVNEKVNLKLKERLRLRAIVHNCAKNGITSEGLKTNQTKEAFANKVMGQLNWYAQLNPALGNPLKERFRQIAKDEKLDIAETVFTRHIDLVEIKPEPVTA